MNVFFNIMLVLSTISLGVVVDKDTNGVYLLDDFVFWTLLVPYLIFNIQAIRNINSLRELELTCSQELELLVLETEVRKWGLWVIVTSCFMAVYVLGVYWNAPNLLWAFLLIVISFIEQIIINSKKEAIRLKKEFLEIMEHLDRKGSDNDT